MEHNFCTVTNNHIIPWPPFISVELQWFWLRQTQVYNPNTLMKFELKPCLKVWAQSTMCDIKVVLLKYKHSGSCSYLHSRSHTCPHFPRPTNHKLHTHTNGTVGTLVRILSRTLFQLNLFCCTGQILKHSSSVVNLTTSHVSSLKSHSLRVFSPNNWTQRATGWRMASQNGFQNKFSLCCDQAVMTPTTQSSEIGQLAKTQACAHTWLVHM